MGNGMSRRRWLASVGAGMAVGSASTGANGARAANAPAAAAAAQATRAGGVRLEEFEPKSMLVVPGTQVPRAKFPVVDAHAHVTGRPRNVAGIPHGEAIQARGPAEKIVAMMDGRNVRTCVNLTGGVGSGLAEAVATFDRAHPGRFASLTEPSYERIVEPGYPKWQADELAKAKAAGARGLKVLKVLGLFLREQVTKGPLVKVDDPRFDPMWEACGALGLPVAIHVSDPTAFFLPIDRFNERYEELNEHPDWSFHGKDYPSDAEILAARDRVLARHPKTTFVGLHVGHSSEDLGAASAALDRFPNLHVEIGARIGELGRQPRASRRFFEKYQDRIMFGTDGPQDDLYPCYFRFLETEDEYFDYGPGRVPDQGRWRIYGVGLPDQILKKVYSENADRVYRLA
jgi:predicted TIM-barrel fold metal-dependent hydrolase